MVPAGEADFLVILSPDQVEPNRHVLRDGGTLIVPEQIDAERLANRKSLNVALLGLLSRHLPIPLEHWQSALRANLAEKLHEANLQAFAFGRSA
jgi:indolepyruvate ferredoxin oxidoreductase beta subunit